MNKLMMLAVSAIVLSACNTTAPAVEETPSNTIEVEQTQEQMMETTPAEGAAMQEQSQSSTVQVDGDNFTFSVTEIKAKQGDTLAVNFTNKEGFHDFVIDELGVNTGMVAAGSSKEVTIPTDKPGTYEFYCSVGDHRAKGMKGTLIIE